MHKYFTNYHTHDSIETCGCVIICVILVRLLVIVQNKKKFSSWLSESFGKKIRLRNSEQPEFGDSPSPSEFLTQNS